MENVYSRPVVDLERIEDQCITLRGRSSIMYAYPFMKEVYCSGIKVVTRDGRTVRKIRIGSNKGSEIVMGILDGKDLIWSIYGRYISLETDSEKDLYIPERYFYKDWKENISLSNAEWYMKFGIRH